MALSRSALQDAAQRFGTPLYVYDADELDAALARVQAAFFGAKLFYAVKANPNLSLLRRFQAAGLGFECVSLGELARAQAVGASGGAVLLNGPAKSEAEYSLAAELGAVIVVDRADELPFLPPASRVLVRLNPGVQVSTHDHLATGSNRSKFGLPAEQVLTVTEELREAGHHVLGLHLHIGSSLSSPEEFRAAFAKVVALRPYLGELEVLDIGGGWSAGADLAQIAYEAQEAASAFGAELWAEPGRYLVGSAGFLLTRVVGVKRTGRNFCLVDAGMTDFLRPMLYGAQHPLYPLWDSLATEVWDVAGPACESGDLLARGVSLPTPQRGSLLVIGEAGAYGASMSSTYLSRARPAEALWQGGEWHLIRRREELSELWATEV